MRENQVVLQLLKAGEVLNQELRLIRFHSPVGWVYSPMEYAWEPYETYIRRYVSHPVKVLFLGMNPGPWGMAQTGIPFGDIHIVKEWLSIDGSVKTPENTHPGRAVLGFDSVRSEVSGKRLWGFFRERFETPEAFFRQHFVANYCPLLFLDAGGRNLTPDRLHSADRQALLDPCDRHLLKITRILEVQWVVGIGKYAQRQAERILRHSSVQVTGILHPSPANPSANRGWSEKALLQLQESGIW